MAAHTAKPMNAADAATGITSAAVTVLFPEAREPDGGNSETVKNRAARKPVFLFLVSILFAGFYHIPVSSALVSVDVPLNDPVYGRLERLLARCPVREDLHAIRPVTEAQLANLAARVREMLGEKADGDADLRAIEIFLKSRSGPVHAGITGGVWGTDSRSEPLLEIDAARVNPLLDQQGGRWEEGGAAGWIEPYAALRWRGWGAADLRPRLPLQWSTEGSGGSFHGGLYTGSLKLGHGGFEAQAGRFEVRWGHGRSGGLILGGTQAPLTGFQLRNAEPVVLPSVFRHLGPLQFSALGARLSEDQTFPHGILVAERMDIRPFVWLELGFSQSVMFGGYGSPHLSARDAAEEIFGVRTGNVSTENFSNRNFMIDLRLQVPPLPRTSVYGELFFEDCCAAVFGRDSSILAGIETPLGTFEWVRTTEITYRHGTFKTGFADRHHLFGHPLGPDAVGFYLFNDLPLTDNLWLTVKTSFERRGRGEKNQTSGNIRDVVPDFVAPEDRAAFVLSPTWQSGNRWVRGSVGFECVNHFRFLANNNRQSLLASVETGFSF